MEKAKVFIAGSYDIIRTVKEQLQTPLFTVLEGTFSGNESMRKITAFYPDIVISDYNLSEMTGLDLARKIEHSRVCPVIILANRMQSEHVEDLKKNSLNIFCITKPINPMVLNHTLSLVLRLTKKMNEYEHQVDDLRRQLEDRKIIEKAKGILMKKFGLDEESAYKEMRCKAMNSSKSIVQIAKTIAEMFKFAEE